MTLLATEDLVKLEMNLQKELAGRVSGLRLQNLPTGLVLNGKSRTYYAKQMAQEILMQSTPLRIWANQIEVSLRPTDSN